MISQERRPTPPEKAVLKSYVDDLLVRGFCKIDSTKHNRIQLFNRFASERDAERSLAYLDHDFQDYLHRTGKKCDYWSAPYVIRTLPLIVGNTFAPGGEEFIKDEHTGFVYANTYRRYKPTGESTEVSPLFHELFERLAPHPFERKVLIQWIAHAIQRPQERPSWHILIPSEPGTGKGFLMEEILHPLLHHTVVARSFRTVMGNFSSVLESSLLILLDDCKSTSDSTQTQLKSILSEERQYVERKHQQGAMVPTYARFILASNERRPLRLDEDERRWFVLARAVHKVSPQETQAFIQELADWLALPGSLSKVWNYLQSVNLDDFNAKAVPHSAGLADMVKMSKSQHALLLEDYVVDNIVFTYSDLVRAFEDEDLSKPSDNQIPHLLREVGYETTRPRLAHFGGKKKSVCHPIGMTRDAINSAFLARPAATF